MLPISNPQCGETEVLGMYIHIGDMYQEEQGPRSSLTGNPSKELGTTVSFPANQGYQSSLTLKKHSTINHTYASCQGNSPPCTAPSGFTIRRDVFTRMPLSDLCIDAQISSHIGGNLPTAISGRALLELRRGAML
jgi:hypothetical protein